MKNNYCIDKRLKRHKRKEEQKWERVHQVKERKTKQQVIKHAVDVENTLFIAGKDFVPVVVLDILPRSENMLGQTERVLLMEKNLFIEDKINPKIINIID